LSDYSCKREEQNSQGIASRNSEEKISAYTLRMEEEISAETSITDLYLTWILNFNNNVVIN
jgi:hypothetical protein